MSFIALVTGESLVEVTVLSLPRCEKIPNSFCCHKTPVASPSTATTANQGDSFFYIFKNSLSGFQLYLLVFGFLDSGSSPDEEDLKLTMAGSLCWRDSHL